ncbi:hypothetical protein F5H01DRAFT_349126 [Linnemannia elongata]|nr:hypothetical protein F5H01DRAFT_349126 [Linnemannia elongata]
MATLLFDPSMSALSTLALSGRDVCTRPIEHVWNYLKVQKRFRDHSSAIIHNLWEIVLEHTSSPIIHPCLIVFRLC